MSACTSEVLPAPEGAAITNNCPRRAVIALMTRCLLDVLNLLAHLLDDDFHIDSGARGFHILRFRGQRVGLAIQLLHQKVEASAGGLARIEDGCDLGQVTA